MGLLRTLTTWSTLLILSPLLIPLGLLALFFSPALLPTLGLLYLLWPRARKAATTATASVPSTASVTDTFISTAQPLATRIATDALKDRVIRAVAPPADAPAGSLGHARRAVAGAIAETVAGAAGTSRHSAKHRSKASPAGMMDTMYDMAIRPWLRGLQR